MLWQRPDQNNPDNWRERYGSLGNVIREWVGPNREPPMLLGKPEAGPSLHYGAARGKSFTGGGFARTDNVGTPQYNNPILGNYQNPSPLVQTANNEYDRILGIYDNLLNKTPSSRIERPTELVPEQQEYTEDPRFTEGINTLTELGQTGGYKPEELAALRERGISPIRSVYANMQRELDRSRSLGGGYSPGFGAVSARMARDASNQLAGQTTKINADIAERVAEGRQRAIPQLTDTLGRVNETRNTIGGRNVDARNRAGEFNRDILGRYNDQLMRQNQADIENPLNILNSRVRTMGQKNDEARLLEQLRQQGGQTLIDAYLRAVQGRG